MNKQILKELEEVANFFANAPIEDVDAILRKANYSFGKSEDPIYSGELDFVLPSDRQTSQLHVSALSRTGTGSETVMEGELEYNCFTLEIFKSGYNFKLAA